MIEIFRSISSRYVRYDFMSKVKMIKRKTRRVVLFVGKNPATLKCKESLSFRYNLIIQKDFEFNV